MIRGVECVSNHRFLDGEGNLSGTVKSPLP